MILGVFLLPSCRPGPVGNIEKVDALLASNPGQPLKIPYTQEPWKYPHGTGVILTSPHYRVFASTHNQDLRGILPGFLEAAYRNYGDLTGLSPAGGANEKPMETYLLASRSEWRELTRSVLGENVPHLSISAGGYSHKGVNVLWDLNRLATLSVAAHEGLHQFLHFRMRHRLPMWAEEGLCVNAEGFHLRPDSVVFLAQHNPSRFGDLRSAIVNGRWISMQQLLSMDAGDAVEKGTEYSVGWYGQLWALVLFLRSNPAYRDGFARLLADAQAGRFDQELNIPSQQFARLSRMGRAYNRVVSRPLFEHYITRDLSAFEKEYLPFAKKLVDLQ